MTEQQSQLAKFERKLAKLKQDEEAIKLAEIENSTVEKRAQKIAKENGISTEEIFMIITRESVGSFINLWNNSMETVVRDTLRGEIKDVVRDVIRAEMAEAYRGIVKGMSSMSNIEEIVKEEMQHVFQEESISKVIKPEVEKVKTPKKDFGRKPISEIDFHKELKQLIIEAHYADKNPSAGNKFKLLGSRQNGLYQSFMKKNKGIKGAWSNYVNDIMKELEKEMLT